MDFNISYTMRLLKHLCMSTGLLATLCLLFSSCEKDLNAVYQQDARVYFFERSTVDLTSSVTSKSYSFLLDPSTITEHIIFIKIKSMGDTASYDRYSIGKRIENGTTARAGEDYEFLPALIPAGEVEGLLPVKIFRNSRIASEEVSLVLTIGETEDFKVGIVEDQVFTLRWSDRLSQPSTWPFYFGEYSDEKYRFVIDILGIAEFPPPDCTRCVPREGQYSYAALADFAARLRAEVLAYNAANPQNPKNFTF
ncbi:hypothetical protein GCM10011418_03140 [Sphingobacterium alkalisoli]|nr:hypothetical protein GCM10011418_03140 [Sphingobacterium alkalisoli]